jgi:cytochrome c6
MVVAYSGGNLIMGSKRGDDVWLFALDGKLGPVSEETAESGANATANADEAKMASLTGNADRGEKVYVSGCIYCHGPHGFGAHGGKSLKEVHDVHMIPPIVLNGRNAMPSFMGLLSDQDIVDVASYIVQVLNKDEAANAK